MKTPSSENLFADLSFASAHKREHDWTESSSTGRKEHQLTGSHYTHEHTRMQMFVNMQVPTVITAVDAIADTVRILKNGNTNSHPTGGSHLAGTEHAGML